MAKYVRYERINKIVTPKELENELKKVVERGFDIISYDEKLLEKSESIERIIITMLLGLPNEGTKQVL